MDSFVVKGTFADAPALGEIRVRQGYAVCEEGKLAGVWETLPEERSGLPLYDAGERLVVPGMTDLHLHAPQYSYCGLAMDKQLLEWLEQYTFPEEARYADEAYAREAYGYFVRDLKQTATTRACIFATIHTGATLELMRQLEEAGMSAYVGKLNMDRNSPATYCEGSAEEGMAETLRWLDACHFSHVSPMVTPRFTPSVTDEYMRMLGETVRERGAAVQSHLSENLAEIDWVRRLCPDCRTYAETYDRFGLFGDTPTVMAHCIYCPEEEKQLLREKQVMIAHCPTSNENVVAGIAPAAAFLRGGWRIGLGSDVAGGHTLNLFEVIRAAVQVSKLRWLNQGEEKPLTFREAFYMATAGGGSFFGRVGLFEAGYAFDAVVLDEQGLRGMRRCTPEERLERYAYLGSGRAEAKWCEGRRIV